MAEVQDKRVYRFVYLKNEGKSDYKETLNGKEYAIKSGEKLRMRRREAIMLRGMFPGDKVEKKLSITPCYDEEVKK